VGAKIIGVVGRDGGYTAEVADACILIPSVNPAHITPHVEAFQAVVWHLLVTHPAVKIEETKWESTTHSEKSRRAVFLDRDGVINRAIVRDGTPHSPATLDELQIFPDVPAALRKLKQLGFQLLVITNQPDVSRGTRTREAVENINNKLSASLPLDDIMVCYHTDADNCTCRKPKPGMILDAARKYDIDLSVSYLVGDRWRDIEAGKNAGCTTIWIDAGYRESQPVRGADARVGSLREAADWIIQAAAKGAAR